jgi:hypothetical protein
LLEAEEPESEEPLDDPAPASAFAGVLPDELALLSVR